MLVFPKYCFGEKSSDHQEGPGLGLAHWIRSGPGPTWDQYGSHMDPIWDPYGPISDPYEPIWAQGPGPLLIQRAGPGPRPLLMI